MKELGLRWRPLGYGALLVAALTGVALALRDWQHTHGVPDRPLGEGRARRLPARRLVPAQLRARPAPAGRDPRRARAAHAAAALVVVGWTSYALTIALPILGVVLARLVLRCLTPFRD